MKKYLFLIISILFANLTYAQTSGVIEEELQEVLNQKSDDLISVNIIFNSQADTRLFSKIDAETRAERREMIIEELKSFSKKSQTDVMSIIEAEERNGKVYKTITCGCGTTEIAEYVVKSVKVIDENGNERKC